jgi:ribose 5-phosphate isomerase A
MTADRPFVTDNGNYIADCIVGEMADPPAWSARFSDIVGVVENGLFIGLASMLVIGRKNGVEVINR